MAAHKTIYTIGHSNRTIEEFLALLTEHKIELLVDVRTVPRSRTNPQFNTDELPKSLHPHGIDYLHMPALGGLRSRRKDQAHSHNTAWENLSFRNYADYAETAPFREGLTILLKLAEERRSAYMCAEAVWWRCHRRIITDYVLATGWDVQHIMSAKATQKATMNDHARLHEDGHIEYPADQQELNLL